MMKRVLLSALLFLVVQGVAAQSAAQSAAERARPEEGAVERRRAYRDELLRLLPPERPGAVTPLDSTWRGWLERTGELPPDFAAMPSIPLLPDPLVLNADGEAVPITTPAQWARKKAWIEEEVQHWIAGTFPPPPENLRAEVLSEKVDGGVVSRMVELRFGPGHQARLTLELLIPPGEGPFPVFMTQWNHRGWALVAVRRGYIGCVYAGADARDDTEAYAALWYPAYDFSRLMRRAWAAHRAVDYLYTLPSVDRERIGITGHSRNGKQSLLAAAFDERITAVVSSSGGTGAENPWRYTSPRYDNNPIAEITTKNPSWFHPRLRFFIGREHKLPVDQNLLVALIAPRPVLLSSALTEPQGNPWGIEQNYRSIRRVYAFLGAEDRLGIRLRQGLHATAARDIEAYLDFFDSVFGRSERPVERTLYYDYTFERWKRRSGERVDPLRFPERGLDDLLVGAGGEPIRSVADWRPKRDSILARIRWGLGEEPPGGKNPGPGRLVRGAEDDYLGEVIGRPEPAEGMGRMVVRPYNSFGDYLYYPADAAGNVQCGACPVVLFLHEYAYPTGFAKQAEAFFEALVRQGYAVFAFDQIGFGTRIEEGSAFYDRYPRWSKMGRMVADVRAALDMLENLPFVDSRRMYAVGYALGGTLGLYSAALDERIAGVASVSGFTPMRLATAEKGLEGIRAYSHLHGLLPRLGFFVGLEPRVPYDFHEILAAVAPRPVYVVAPTLDRDAHHADVRTAVQAAKEVYALYGREAALAFFSPHDMSRFAPEVEGTPGLTSQQRLVLNWLSEMGARGVRPGTGGGE